MKRVLVVVALMFSAVAGTVAVQRVVDAAANNKVPSSVVPVTPVRVFDTRTRIDLGRPLGPGEALAVQVAGVAGIPQGATGVIVTITAVDATVPTFITAWDGLTGQPPLASILNPADALAVANTVTLPLSPTGGFYLYNAFGNVHLVADVSGYLKPISP